MKFELTPVDGKTTVGKLVEMEYHKFKSLVTKDTLGDFYAKVDLDIAQKIEAGKDIKRAVDAEAKKLKKALNNLREFTTKFMLENKLSKVTGDGIKSINLQEPKFVKKTISEKQILIGRKYVPLSELSKDDLVELLEKKGVKTRVYSYEVEEEKFASIRVLR